MVIKRSITNRQSRALGGSNSSTQGAGLGAAFHFLSEDFVNADNSVERALKLARDACDAKAMRDLRNRLTAMMASEGAELLTRNSALGLLSVISDGLKAATDLFVGMVGEDLTLVKNHAALDLLDEFIDAIIDLDNAKSHAALTPASYAANASLSISERKWDDEVLAAVLVVKRAKGFKTRKEAEEFLATKLNASGRKHRGRRRYSASSLKTLRDDQKKRKALHTRK
jgi:hypothetical protein